MIRTIKKRFIILAVILILFGFIYLSNERITISKITIISNKIPENFDEVIICQISDLHNKEFGENNNKLIKKINNVKPNIIVITGDLIDSNHLEIDVAIEFINNIKYVAPIYFVPGNHESNINDYELFKNMLIDNNVIILDNKVNKLSADNDTINLIGIEDPTFSFHPSLSESERTNSVLKDLDYDNDKFTILLSHRPELFDIYVENKIDLVLTGHAHGGQVRIPFVGGMFSPNQGLFPKYDSGMFKEKDTQMYVSRGLGNSVIPFRINNNPELVVITLKTK